MSASYNEHRIHINYHGKTYTRLSDLAKAANISTKTIQSRWSSGIRNLNDLLSRQALSTSNAGPIPIRYGKHNYASLKDFARVHKLSYPRVLSLYRLGIHNGTELLAMAKPHNQSQILQQVAKDSRAYTEDYLNSHGLLSASQVSAATGIREEIFYELSGRIDRGQNNHVGIQQGDIVPVDIRNVADNEDIVNQYVLPVRGFAPTVIDHIKEHQNFKESLVLIPFFNDNYYFSPDNETIWGYRKKTRALKQLTPHPGSSSYTFRDNSGQRYNFTVADIKDLIANPTVRANDLITKDDIIKRCGLSKSIWNNRKLSRLLPYSTRHNRYDKTGKKVSGWDRKYVQNIIENNSDKFRAKK